MRERVSCILGKKPVVLVCPHGADDANTDIITELAAKQLNCYAVINRGFERADAVDIDADKANCNRVDHVKQDVVFEEFLKPLLKFEQKLAFRNNKAPLPWPYSNHGAPVHVFHVHGCGNVVHAEAGDVVEVIVGYGRGQKKDSLTCEAWRKNLFVALYRKYAHDGEVFEAGGGSRYGGRDANNMNQYFRKHDIKPWVESMQLEFPFSTRDSRSRAVSTAMLLSSVLDDYLKVDEFADEPAIRRL